MIKLQTLLEDIYTDKPDAPDMDLMQQGFKLGEPTNGANPYFMLN